MDWKKFLSRKFLVAGVGVLVGVGVATGWILPESAARVIELVTGAAIVIASVLGYEVAEGWGDAAQRKAEK